MRQKPSNPGFTLIEILVVITLIGLLMGVATLAVRGFPYRQLQSDAEQLVYQLNHLADNALMRQQWIRWVYDPETHHCDTQVRLANGTWETDTKKNGCSFKAITSLAVELTDWHTKKVGDETAAGAAIHFLPSGDYTAFTLTLNGSSDKPLILTGDGRNAIRIEGTPP